MGVLEKVMKDDRDLLSTPYLSAQELRLGLETRQVPFDRITQQQPAFAKRGVGNVGSAGCRQGPVAAVAKQPTRLSCIALHDLHTRWKSRIQSQALRARLGVFPPVGR